MRILVLLTAFALLPAATAQTADDDGCTHSDPCPWVVDVDANGFQDYIESEVTFSVGDWYEILVYNDDTERSHTLTLSGHDKSITVPKDGFATDTGAFQLTKAGTFELTDSPSGDKILVHVVEDDALGGESGSHSGSTTGKSSGAPALPWAFAGLALLGLALLRRR